MCKTKRETKPTAAVHPTRNKTVGTAVLAILRNDK